MSESTTATLQSLPGSRYYPEAHLATWHPQGVLDDEFADRVVALLEDEEYAAENPFDRYTDMSGLTAVRLSVGRMFRISERRRAGYAWTKPVKSAFYCPSMIGFGLARMYELLMEKGPIQVRVFRTREDAAEWLGVSVELLMPGE